MRESLKRKRRNPPGSFACASGFNASSLHAHDLYPGNRNVQLTFSCRNLRLNNFARCSEKVVMPNKDGGHTPNYTPVATVDIESGLIVGEDVLNFRQFLLRGLERVQTEWRWATTAFNLHRLMSLVAHSRAGPDPTLLPHPP